MNPRLVPELKVSDLQESLNFYVNVLGFNVLYDRAEDRFAYLEVEGAHLMIEELSEHSRQFDTAPLEKPLGRGMNLQIQVSNVNDLYERVMSNQLEILIAIEDKWYRNEAEEGGNRQFVVADPDGYLLRFFSYLGSRPIRN